MADNNLKFEEKDAEKITEFLNFLAKKAKFEVTVAENIKLFGLLSYMQQILLKKVSANISEIVAIHTPPAPKSKKAKKSPSKEGVSGV